MTAKTDSPDLPPKRVKNQIVRLDQSLRRLEQQQYAGIQRAPDSLPVLEAFHAFLEQERARSRKRIIAVTAIAAASVLLLALAGSATIFVFARHIAGQQAGQTRRADALAAAITNTASTMDIKLTTLSRELRDAHHQAEEARRLLSTESADASQRIDQTRTVIATLGQRIAALHSENKRLDTELDRFVAEWPNLTNTLASLQRMQSDRVGSSPISGSQRASGSAARTDSASQAVDGQRPADATRTPTDARTPAARPERATLVAGGSIALSVVPEGEALPIRWLLPGITTRE